MKAEGRERRAQQRYAVDSSASIIFVRGGSILSGRVLDLSSSGCRICTDERFPVGIYTRVETEFQVDGLPFRLAGVIQAVHGPRLVGIRFLDVSERKRTQLVQLILEIQTKEASGGPAQPQDAKGGASV
jgi:c-di-GMP-binding flagellar brake protein YcgR